MTSCAPHVVITAAGVDLDADASRAPDVDESFQALKSELAAVRNRATPFIGAPVGRVVQELVHKVSVGGVHYEHVVSKGRMLMGE